MTLWLFQGLPPTSSNFSDYSFAKPHRERPCHSFLRNGLSWFHFSKWPILVNYYLSSLRWWLWSLLPGKLCQPFCTIGPVLGLGPVRLRATYVIVLADLWDWWFFCLSLEPQHTVATVHLWFWLTKLFLFLILKLFIALSSLLWNILHLTIYLSLRSGSMFCYFWVWKGNSLDYYFVLIE